MKRNIALVWGGYTSEIVVSKKSADGIQSFLDKDKYNVYRVCITRDSWTVELDGKTYPIDKNNFSFFDENTDKRLNLDFAYITIHGSPGEDGLLQGYFEMLGIAYSTCGVMTSSLTMNKYVCNNYLKNFGITVAKSMILKNSKVIDTKGIAKELGLPMFVKPNTGGSSFATTKVKTEEQIEKAVLDAFGEAKEVIAESLIEGKEVTCGCYKVGDKKTAFPLTEVVTSNEFFDYKAKYEGEVEEITPARISDSLTNEIQELTLKIYDLVGAKGIIRVDFFITPNNKPVLLEVNTTPGMTKTSFIPQQVAVAGLSITEVLTNIIENEFKN